MSYLELLLSLALLFSQHPTLRAACITGFMAFAAFGALWATMAPLLAGSPYHLGADVAGLFGLLGVVSIINAPMLGRIADRFGSRVMLAAGPILLLIASVALSQTWRTLWLLGLGVVLFDIGYRSVLIANQTRIYPLQADAQGRLNTVFMTSVFLGGAIGSLCGAVAAAWSWAGVALVGATFAASGLAAHFATRTR